MATNNAVNNSLTGQTGTGNFVGSTSPTLTTPKIVTQINDSNGNAIVGLGATGSAVNYLTITNQATGTPPFLSSSGTDTNIPINLQSKGDSPINFLTTALTNPFTIVSGTAGQHVTSFSFSNTSASQSVTFPDLTGTVQLSSNTGTAGQVLTSNGAGVAPSYQNAAGGTDAAFGFLLMGG